MATMIRPEGRTRPAWWLLTLVVFGGTVLWAARFAYGYLLTPAACEIGDRLLHAGSVGFGVLSVGVLLVNLWLLRRPFDQVVRFTLLVGLGLNVFFLAVLLLESSSVFFVDACAKGAIP